MPVKTPVCLGAFARIDEANEAAIRRRVDALINVESFDLDEPGKIGLFIEAPDLDAAHDMLTGTIGRMEGVLAVWPVYVNLDEYADVSGSDSTARAKIASDSNGGKGHEGFSS